jgi:hypothetical protein
MIRSSPKEKHYFYRKKSNQELNTHFEHTYILASLNLPTAKQMFFSSFPICQVSNLEYICTLKSE